MNKSDHSRLNWSEIPMNGNCVILDQSQMIIPSKEMAEGVVQTKVTKPSRKNFCYTCKPRGKVLKHIIEKSDLKGVVFHFDMHKRPIILVTPKNHYNNIFEIPESEVTSLLNSIRIFCKDWNINDYQISFNNGKWQTHSHFHIKIKANEKAINRLRRDHFKLQNLEDRYS